MILKVPFRTGPFFREKNVEFIFKIATLEQATEEILKCDLWEVESQNAYDVNVALLLAAYQVACQKRYKKPKYNIHDAAFWMEHMSKESQTAFIEAVKELTGKMTKGKEKKK